MHNQNPWFTTYKVLSTVFQKKKPPSPTTKFRLLFGNIHETPSLFCLSTGHIARGQRPFVRQRHAVPGAAPGTPTGGRGRLLHQHVHGGQMADGRLVTGTVHTGRRTAGSVAGTRVGRPTAAATHQSSGLHHPAHIHEGEYGILANTSKNSFISRKMKFIDLILLGLSSWDPVIST